MLNESIKKRKRNKYVNEQDPSHFPTLSPGIKSKKMARDNSVQYIHDLENTYKLKS